MDSKICKKILEWMDRRMKVGRKVAHMGEWIVRYAKRFWNGWIE